MRSACHDWTGWPSGPSFDRAEHLAWCKQRAIASFFSDLSKREATAGHAVIELIGMQAIAGLLNEREARRLIEGAM